MKLEELKPDTYFIFKEDKYKKIKFINQKLDNGYYNVFFDVRISDEKCKTFGYDKMEVIIIKNKKDIERIQ